ncbi:phenolic glucoside malonyltransferase 2-like [Carex rostrata]
MASISLPLNIMETSRVAPQPGTTTNRAPLPFTFFDVFWINLPPVDRLFFYPYRHPTAHFISSHLPSLKHSLSLALATYPLAGGYHLKPGTDGELEHYYKEGDTVSFTVAECVDGQFEDLASNHERDVSQLDCLVPLLPKSGDDEELKPVFAVQVTVFPEQGIVIGTSLHHTVCDGSTSMQFMHTWAETCLSGVLSSSRVPVFDRSLVSDPSNLYSFFYNETQKMLKSAPKRVFKPRSDLVVATFTFRQWHIQGLKQLVSTKAEQRKMSSFHCSTIVIAFAYIWSCFVQAKGIDSSKRACIGIAADVRARIQPPIPVEYFGNCIVICLASANVADLIQNDGIVMAAKAISKAVAQPSERLKSARNWMQEYAPFAGVPVLTVAGSPKFRAYDIDFGFGRPTKVEIISATKAGAMSVAESRDEEGGVEIGIAFPKDEMDCFRKCFSNGLKLVSE